MPFSSLPFLFVLESTGCLQVNVEITAILQQYNQSHFSSRADKVRITHSDWLWDLCSSKLEYKIRDSFIKKKKKKKIESVVIHSKKALQTADTVQENRRCWPFYYRLFCSVALRPPRSRAHPRTHTHTYTPQLCVISNNYPALLAVPGDFCC